jgi:hypothetical protein
MVRVVVVRVVAERMAMPARIAAQPVPVTPVPSDGKRPRQFGKVA